MAIGFNQSGVAFDSPLYTFDGTSLAPPVSDSTFQVAAFSQDSRATIRTTFRAQYDQTANATWRE